MDGEGQRAPDPHWCRYCWSPSRGGYAARGVARGQHPAPLPVHIRRSGTHSRRPGIWRTYCDRGPRTAPHRARRSPAAVAQGSGPRRPPRCPRPSPPAASAWPPATPLSVTTTTSSAPLSWHAAGQRAREIAHPGRGTPGFCTTTQAVSSSIWSVRSSVPSRSGSQISILISTYLA